MPKKPASTSRKKFLAKVHQRLEEMNEKILAEMNQAARSEREGLKDESARDLALCKRLVDECFASQDYAEGRTAFMEKRKPRFIGR